MSPQMSEDEVVWSRPEAIRQAIRAIETAKQTQPERLAEARAAATDERTRAQAAEPWSATLTSVPAVTGDGDLSGMLSMPTIEGKEVFGTRLAFDLLGCCGDEDEVEEKLNEFCGLVGEPDHMVAVCAAALATIAEHVVPVLLDTLERSASDYDSRVRLAEAARNAWAVRVGTLDDVVGEGL